MALNNKHIVWDIDALPDTPVHLVPQMRDLRQIWTVGWLNEIIKMTDPSNEPPRIIILHRMVMQRYETVRGDLLHL